jgi:ATP-binding cassette subfamily B protein
MRILLRLLKSLRPYTGQMALLLVCLLVVTATSLVTPGIIRFVIDEGLQRGEARALAQAGLIIVSVGLVRSLFNFGKRYVSEWLINRTGYACRSASTTTSRPAS